MQLFNRFALIAFVMLAGCAGGRGPHSLPPAIGDRQGGAIVADSPVRVGPPYQIGGVTYTPRDERYDQVGLASFYGQELAGRPTANGESFNPGGISAAHRTLPLPSYVEVTSLETGQTILVRINDRGPFSPDRIVDLSLGAAQMLGIANRGTAPVRVRRVDPPDADRVALRSGRAAPERLAASPQLLAALRTQFDRGGGTIPDARPPETSRGATIAGSSTATAPVAPQSSDSPPPGVSWIEETARGTATPPPRATPAPAATSGYYVQLGAFSNAGNAQRLAGRARSLGNVVVDSTGSMRRVRLGPYADAATAEQALARARSAGYHDARIFRDR